MSSSSVSKEIMFLVFLLIIFCASSIQANLQKPYIVYTGRGSTTVDTNVDESAAESSHLHFLSSIIPSYKTVIGHTYYKAFKGFSALLTDDEASTLSRHEEVVSIFPDPVLELHTTRSWDFLNLKLNNIQNQYPHNYNNHPSTNGDVIVGVIDSGIWPESQSFSDTGFGKIPSKWKGVCMEGPDFKNYHCNRKLIGARFYKIKAPKHKSNKTKSPEKGSPRDDKGHGTHTASIATGRVISNASYYGLAKGIARGGLPSARLAIYKACIADEGCLGSLVLKAIDDAIGDGVDIISISIGSSSILQDHFLNDPIGIGAFHAMEKGVMVVASAGNEGPLTSTVVNTAPWIFTVAASTVDRDFECTVILGNKQTFKGKAINLSPFSEKQSFPLVFGETIAINDTSIFKARYCEPGTLDAKKVVGKIVVCLSGGPPRNMKRLYVQDAKAKGMVFVERTKTGSLLETGLFPFIEVGNFSGSQILNYINSTKYPTATILATIEINKIKPSPVVADFSSRGPGKFTENIIKPDITAPGVSILAAVLPTKDLGNIPRGEKAATFGIRSGTSMACPHVAGAAAFIKATHHNWSPSMIKSALMTTAIVYSNIRKPMTNTTFDISNPHEMGAGEINPMAALDPGLVFETTTNDYLNFLCHFGYKKNKITKKLTNNTSFSCPKKHSKRFISSMNYPSISIETLDKNRGAKKVKRVAKNVGFQKSTTYVSYVHAPQGLSVKVQPEKLVFNEEKKVAEFEVSFDGKYSSKGYKFGSITWYDGFHRVRIAFAVDVV